jgi:hypothetical protein
MSRLRTIAFFIAVICFVLAGAVMFDIIHIKIPFGSIGFVFLAIGMYIDSLRR